MSEHATTGSEIAPVEVRAQIPPVAPAFLRVRLWVKRPIEWIRQRWQRHLMYRTVISTLLFTSLALLAAGAFLSNQISSALFSERFNQISKESERGLAQARSILESASTTDRVSTQSLVNSTLATLEGDGATVIRDFVLKPIPVAGDENLYVGPTASGSLTTRVVPDDLAESVQSDSGIFWRSIELGVGSEIQPGIIIGTKVLIPPGREYGLYLVYDLSSVQDTLEFINRAMAFTGLVLLLVVGFISWSVSRTVVRPVADAAYVSERIASGDLDRRMKVAGKDEVARLGTAFNHMAHSLQEQITQLNHLSAMQQRFVSDVSHELRTPLTTVRMAAELIHDARENFDPLTARSAELMYEQIERFQNLLNDLLEVSRFDAGVAVLDRESTDLNVIVRKVIDTATPVADEYGSIIRFNAPAEGCVAEFDPRRVERVVRNLVLNAVEHGEQNPIDITIGQNESSVAVTVRDYGIGMSPEACKHVFDRFWRADPARARTTGGSGLGLSISMEDTRLHDGRLEAWGKKGVGSAFRLTLPRTAHDAITSSPLPLEPPVTEEILGLLGDSFPLTGEVPKIGYTPLILDDEDILIEDEIFPKPVDPSENPGEGK
ncbi:two-component sensor histidine kinase [Arthrobacter sp. MYb211]|nr:two-component sensor histidine kinase [Arthrobacter sp. MYb224]PRA06304.1 two-component sensor histidine kinase [Arthrobacter sp. MYb229]PRA12759.1 two-component sensor histidine kinase [Arthrobacter sp. MYb221]PRB53206.1 two-component sensor histidine kinase [Arthrobacter sp. MYb216]PRC09720.1 two-component sensor histidine kinase [Arthrobacter sp. MYb211]